MTDPKHAQQTRLSRGAGDDHIGDGARSSASNFRTKLWLLAIGASALTVAVATYFMAGPSGGKYVMPGGLSAQHASLVDRCDTCHLTSIDSIKSPLSGLAETRAPYDQSRLCLACHLLGDHALEPHDVDAKELRASTQRLAGASAAINTLSRERIACAVCHHEHQGAEFNLISLTNSQCQTCHTSQFEGFKQGHPELHDYPYSRPTRIAFNHEAHFSNYFKKDPNKQAPTACNDCHVPDSQGATMLMRSFEQSCASCHALQIAGDARADAKGVPVITLPALDVQTLRSRGAAIGAWPADSRYDEAPLTPFMKLALASDPQSASDLDALQGVDLLDLADASDQQIVAVARLTRAINKLHHDIATGGQRALLDRFEKALGRPLDRAQASALLAQLPVDAARAASLDWLGDAPAGDESPVTDSTSDEAQGAENEASGDDDLDLLTGDDDDLLAEDDDPAASVTAEPGAAKTPADSQLTGEDWVAVGGWHRRDTDFVLAYRPTGHGDAFVRAWLDATSAPATGPGAGAASAIFDSLADQRSPGSCVKCHTIDAAPPGASNQSPGADRHVNWRPWTNRSRSRPFTRFDHGPHLLLADADGCLMCHTLNTQGVMATDRSASAGGRFRPDFSPLTKQSCVKCHAPTNISDTCLSCHNYHVNPMGRRTPHTLLPEPQAPSAPSP